MYTQCPSCATLFRVEKDLVTAPDRRVRCCMCLTVFDAGRRYASFLPAEMQTLVAKYQAEIEGDESPAPGRSRRSGVDDDAGIGPEAQSEAIKADAEVAPDVEGPVASLPLTLPDDDPADDWLRADRGEDWHLASRLELETGAGASERGTLGLAGWAWAFGILCLTLGLVLQVAWFQRNELAAYPHLRPWLEQLCTLAGCELPLQRDPDQIRLVRSQVTDHPDRAGALVATAVLVNQASFPQPYPLLKLSLLDQNQRVAGERWFHPGDYLDDPGLRMRWAKGMPMNHPVAVRLELVDPGSGSAQYVFDYR